MTEPMHKTGSALQTPGGMTGIVWRTAPSFADAKRFYEPWAEAADMEIEDFLRSKHLVHPANPRGQDGIFYLLYVATRPALPFLVSQVDARMLVPGNGQDVPVEFKLPEPDENTLELTDEAPGAVEIKDAQDVQIS